MNLRVKKEDIFQYLNSTIVFLSYAHLTASVGPVEVFIKKILLHADSFL